MTDKGTIKIPREDFERHNERRKDLGLEWREYIDGQAPEIETIGYDDVRAAAKAGAREAIEESVQR